jgi:hypothetical protein
VQPPPYPCGQRIVAAPQKLLDGDSTLADGLQCQAKFEPGALVLLERCLQLKLVTRSRRGTFALQLAHAERAQVPANRRVAARANFQAHRRR